MKSSRLCPETPGFCPEMQIFAFQDIFEHFTPFLSVSYKIVLLYYHKENTNGKENFLIMKKLTNICLKLSCGALGAFILSVASLAPNSISWFSTYEYKMPDKLASKAKS